MITTETKLTAVKSLIDACMAERGCSRLNAAQWAANECLKEYNRIQMELGSKARSQIVDCGWLNVLLEEHANAGLPEVPASLDSAGEPTPDDADGSGGSYEPDDSMDGDAASALASAGFGTDEDYEHGTPGLDDGY